MIVVVCTDVMCSASFRVMGDPVEVHTLVGTSSEFWPDRFVCPICGQPAVGALEGSIDTNELGNLRDLEAQELFQALNGMGLPEEQECSLEAVTGLLLTQRITKTVGHNISGTKRYCLECLEFEGGQRMYFAAGTHGATVYRITKPIHHTEEVLRELDEHA